MATFFEQVNQAVEAVGRKAQATIDQVRLMGEKNGLTRRRDQALRDLGRLVHGEARGAAPNGVRREELLTAIDVADAELARIDKELAAAKGEVVSVKEEAPPAPPPTE
ncbi:MAG: hypothetical protein ACHQXA_03315 [Gemmatimonadales bacterium]